MTRSDGFIVHPECLTPVSRVLIKIIFWFDVLASVTTRDTPFNMDYIRATFDGSYIGVKNCYTTQDQFSMLDPMGCENNVICALAEISALSKTKQDSERLGSLDVENLVKGGNVIKSQLGDAWFGPEPLHLNEHRQPVDIARGYTAKLFRGAAHIYLSTVIHGDQPHVSKTSQDVRRVFQLLEQLKRNTNTNTISSVVRSAVFPIYIACALATNYQEAKTGMDLLSSQRGAGNCTSIHNILERIWSEREQAFPGSPVPWRERLTDDETGRQMLLV